MYTTLALAAVLGLAPSQAGKLTLTNVQPTYGLLGAPRNDTKVYPGDEFWVAFDIENIKFDETGKARYTIGLEATDSKGKLLYRREEDKSRVVIADNYFGGNKLPAFSYLEVRLDMPAGQYTMKVTVTDRSSNAQASFDQKFEVLPSAFALTRFSSSYDPGMGIPAPPVGVSGQVIYLNFAAVGFVRDPKKQASLTLEMRVLDEAGKPTLAKPVIGQFNEIPEANNLFHVQFPFGLNRPGKFRIELKATDNIGKKNYSVTFPLTVLTPAKGGGY
jgi:hypothetical protein